MFRFSQKLREILRDLTSDEQAQLDRYDLELEDALSSGGDLWEVAPADLHPITNPTTFTLTTVDAINLTPAGALTAHSGGNSNVYADGTMVAGSAGNATFISDSGRVNITANGTGANVIITTGSGQIRLVGIPTSDPGVPGAIYSLAGTLHISP